MGRFIKPIVIDSDPNFASQHMWADAIFIREISRLSNLAAAKLLKMGILAYMYGSPDVAFLCFKKGIRTHLQIKVDRYIKG